MNPEPIIIVGAGWAGLSAAYTLSQRDRPILLLEAAPQAGGRARGISFKALSVDNGQHLMIGAYTQTLALLRSFPRPVESVVLRAPFELRIWNAADPLKSLYLSFPTQGLNKIGAFFKWKGISLYERFKIAQFFYKLHQQTFKLAEDCSIEALLLREGQPSILIEKLWAPLALAALSTPIDKASAKVFLEVLKDFMDHMPTSTDWLLPKVDLSTLLPEPILEALQKRSHTIQYHQRVQSLLVENGRCVGVSTSNQIYKGHKILLATPPAVTADLLGSHPELARASEKLRAYLGQITYEPITTVYLRYAAPLSLPSPVIGLQQATGHWLFDRAFCGQPTLASVVITGSGAHSRLSHAALAQKISEELAPLFPTLQQPLLEYKVVCEKKAAFSCVPSIKDAPFTLTPFPHLVLAGDYLHPRYPATLEGAVDSGIRASHLI